jgi:L-alanine-DL-glutamate epimerase-like enolase superfamily enzyme
MLHRVEIGEMSMTQKPWRSSPADMRARQSPGDNMEFEVRQERWPMRTPFRISGMEFTDAELVVVELRDGQHIGRGEACGVYYKGDDPARMIEMAQQVANDIRAGATRAELQQLLPASGARNAIDCALWELEARRTGTPVWALTGLAKAPPLPTFFTIGIDTPEEMARRARDMIHATAIKLKLSGDGGDAARVEAVRTARPEAWLAVDANRGFTIDGINALIPCLERARVALVEQPLALGHEAEMAGLDGSIPTAADESVQDIDDLAPLVGLFDIINIKLDKCGGLTHALAMEAEARRLGFKVMVGNMTGTSWSQAPAFVLGQRCDFCDLDGPTFLVGDREDALWYDAGKVYCPDTVWGGPQ